MEWNWLQSFIFGLLAGFSEFLPVSSDAHQLLFAEFNGAGNEILGFRLVGHIGAAAALLFSCRLQIRKIVRETRIAATPKRRRKRQPDIRVILDYRILRTISIPLLLGFILYAPAIYLGNQLWIVALLMALNGLLLYLPQFFRSGNKETRTIFALDSLLIGLGGVLAVLPGFSRIGALTTAAKLRGCDSRYGTDMSLLALIPAMAVLIGFDVYFLISASAALTLKWVVYYIISAFAAFASAYFGILLVRFLAVKIGFSGFSYYCWGAALLVFILYLTI